MPPSRPIPERPAPPNGVRRSRRNQQLTQVIPTRNLSATRCPRFRFVVQTEAANPYFVSFALATASSSVSNGPKYFLLNASSRFCKASPHRRLYVKSVVPSITEFRCAAARDQRSAFLLRKFIVGENLGAMFFRNQRACCRLVVRGPAEHQALSFSLQSRNEALKDRAFHINTLGAKANLARIQENSISEPVDGFFEITIGENNRCIFPAQFK